MKALSIRQPWAHAIIYLGKDVENRDWRTNFRGTIAVHASQGMTFDEFNDFISFAGQFSLADIPDPEQLVRGAIVGLVDIVDCVSDSSSDWFQGDYGFVLANPRALTKPIPCKGALGFWDVPKELERGIKQNV
jgi:hypothetical protein